MLNDLVSSNPSYWLVLSIEEIGFPNLLSSYRMSYLAIVLIFPSEVVVVGDQLKKIRSV